MVHAFGMMLVTGTAVVIAGILLGWSADRIANATGLGELWTGWVLLAGATSVPEFVTDTSAVRINAANLAGGDLFGSSLTNMAILAVLALSFAPGSENASTGNKSAVAIQSPPGLFNAGLALLLKVLGTAFTLLHSNIPHSRRTPRIIEPSCSLDRGDAFPVQTAAAAERATRWGRRVGS